MQIILSKNEMNEILTKYVAERMNCSGNGKIVNDNFLFEIEAPKIILSNSQEDVQEETIKKLDEQLVEEEPIKEEDLPSTGKEVEPEEPKEQEKPVQKTHSLFSNLQRPTNK